MYLHIGKSICLNEKDIISIFNIEYIKNTKDYKSFYQKLEEENKIIDISNGNKKSFILIKKGEDFIGYISNINSNTIGKRKI